MGDCLGIHENQKLSITASFPSILLQLKEMCRRELDKAESEIKKNSSIIGDYKQVSRGCLTSGSSGKESRLGRLGPRNTVPSAKEPFPHLSW